MGGEGGGGEREKKPKHRVEKRHAELGTADDTSQNLRVWKSNLEIHKHQLSVILGRGITRTGGFCENLATHGGKGGPSASKV